MKTRPLILALALALVLAFFLIFGLLRKLEKDQLFVLEESMLTTARALVPKVRPGLAGGEERVDDIKELLATTQNATGSRIRILSSDRSLWADSLPKSSQPSEQLRFRPEIQDAFAGLYGAYTRLSDETENSLALFVALPVEQGDKVIGAVYVSHSTDHILQQLGVLRRAANKFLLVLAGLVFMGALILTGQLSKTLSRLRFLTRNVEQSNLEEIPIEGHGQVAEIGENFNKLVGSLRAKISELEEEKKKTKHFLEDVAHELKTPIAGLAGSLEALEGELDDASRDKMLKNVGKETHRLSELTSKLLELQKLDYTELKRENFDLISVAETVVDTFQPVAKKGGVDLILTTVEELIACGDANKIRRVLENLVENSIRCTPSSKKVEIRLGLAEEHPRVSILDEGPGPPDAKLFERHAQGERFGGSLGLGLSIASEILRQHEQTLHLEAREGEGSHFYFSLARHQSDTELTTS